VSVGVAVGLGGSGVGVSVLVAEDVAVDVGVWVAVSVGTAVDVDVETGVDVDVAVGGRALASEPTSRSQPDNSMASATNKPSMGTTNLELLLCTRPATFQGRASRCTGYVLEPERRARSNISHWAGISPPLFFGGVTKGI